MTYALISPQPAPRDEALEYDEVGPGLYPGETAVELDDGNFVAVSVDKTWLENGGGMSFKGCARWINADGSTKLTDAGQHIETNASHTADAVTVDTLGFPAIAKEVVLLVLGEDPTLVDADGEDFPLIPWAAEMRLNASIKKALALTGESGPTAMDVTALLGLAA